MFKFLPVCFCPFWFHQCVTASVPPADRWTPPSIPDPSFCSVAQVFLCSALWRFLSVIRHASAGLLRRRVPAHRGGPGRLARRPLGPDSLPLSARGPGVTVGPGNGSPAPPHPGTRIGSKPPHVLSLCRLFISCSHQEVRTEWDKSTHTHTLSVSVSV